jgi:hypothetical protein
MVTCGLTQQVSGLYRVANPWSDTILAIKEIISI